MLRKCIETSIVSSLLVLSLHGSSEAACLSGSFNMIGTNSYYYYDQKTKGFTRKGETKTVSDTLDLQQFGFCITGNVVDGDAQENIGVIHANLNGGKSVYNKPVPAGYPVEYTLEGRRNGNVITFNTSATMFIGQKANNKMSRVRSFTANISGGRCILTSVTFKNTVIHTDILAGMTNSKLSSASSCSFE